MACSCLLEAMMATADQAALNSMSSMHSYSLSIILFHNSHKISLDNPNFLLVCNMFSLSDFIWYHSFGLIWSVGTQQSFDGLLLRGM